MAYTINLTDGTVFATVNDGTVNTASSMTLVGKNYAGYGEFLDENFIHLLENASNTTAPPAPLTGQLWWDKTNGLLKVYTGTQFKPVALSTASSATPTNPVTGELWYDTTNVQLKVYTGAAFTVVGPAYTSSQGVSGTVGETILDNSSTPHYVTTVYANNTRIAIFSSSAFTVKNSEAQYSLFPYIYVGETLSNAAGTTVFTGNILATTTSATGNIIGGNVLTVGLVSATGNVYGLNFVGNVVVPAGSVVSTTGNITGGNILTSGLISSTGNLTSGNILTGGLVSATGNVTGNYLLGNAFYVTGLSPTNIYNGTSNVSVVSSGGNVSVGIGGTGNVAVFATTGEYVTGLVSASGNVVAGSFFLGDGGKLSNVSAAVSVTQIQNGTSNADITTSGGSFTIGVGGTSNVVVVDTSTLYANVLSATSIVKGGSNAVGNIGSSTQMFNAIFSSVLNAGTITGTANITGGNVLTGGLISATGAITGAAITGSSLTVSTGNISGGNINNNNSNGVGNIGSASTYFNRIFAQATTALYADVAERFASDEVLDAGTVVELGGTAEITKSLVELSDKVFGVISTRAAYLMNGGAGEDDTHPPVAMTGRVPVKVIGIVHKGDRLVSAGDGIARAAQPGEITAFNVIGRSLVDKPTSEAGTIEAIVTIKN